MSATGAAGAAAFWEGCAEGVLRMRACGACTAWHHMAPDRCPRCRSSELTWVSASGRGRVASWTVVHRAPGPALRAEVPYALGLVDLVEGPRMMARLVGPLDDVRVGAAVRFRTVDGVDGRKLPAFELAASDLAAFAVTAG